jgi:PAS domain S-box-containing protein
MHPPDAPRPGATLLDGMLEDMLQSRYLVVDGRGRISRWSAGAERLLGWREDEVAGRSAFAQPLAWAGEGVELWKRYLDAPQSGRPPARASLTMLCRGGWGLAVEMTAVPVPLVLGYEFTMLVADLAVGGPGSQSEDRLMQLHPLAADAIASALREDAPAVDSVAGLLVTLRGVGDPAAIEDPDAEHAARALAIERDEQPGEPVEEELPAPDDGAAAEDLVEAQASLQAASDELTRLREETGRLRSELGEQRRSAEEARADAGRLSAALDQATSQAKLATSAAEAARGEREARAAELEASGSRCDELAASLEAARAELDRALADYRVAASELETLGAERDQLAAEHDRLRVALEGAAAERDELRRELDRARAALRDAAEERDSVGAAATDTEREREALRTELERAARQCEELSAALDAKTAELQALPGKAVLEAAKRDRDEARSALAAALRERDRAAGALEAAAGERDGADAALRQAEAERDEARTALAEMASETEAARAAVAEHEARAEELGRRLDDAERAAAARAADVEAATREASEQRDRVAAGFLATEALARERARVSELQAQIAALTGELEGALARAAEHAPEPTQTRRRAAGPARPFQPGLDDVESPRAHIGLDGRFIAINEPFCELVGYAEDEFSSAYWPPVVDADHRHDLRRATARVIAGEVAGWDVDTVYMASDGTLVRVVGTIRLERDASGSATHLVLDAEPLSAVTA